MKKGIFCQLMAFNLSQKINQTLGLKLKELIIDCNFNQKSCDFENDFVEVYYFLYGQCFRFNSGKNSDGNQMALKTITDIGMSNGLHLKVFTGNPELSYPSESMGLHIMIHNSTIEPTNYDGFEIQTGVKTNIAVNRLFIYKKENPYSDCVSDIQNYIPDFLSQFLKTGYQYRQKDCLKLCLQSIYISKLGCYYPAYNRLNCTKPCLSDE